MNGIRKISGGREGDFGGVQAWDRESVAVSEEEFNDQLARNEKTTPRSEGLRGGRAYRGTERWGERLCVWRGERGSWRGACCHRRTSEQKGYRISFLQANPEMF